jgi:hypothetical protein
MPQIDILTKRPLVRPWPRQRVRWRRSLSNSLERPRTFDPPPVRSRAIELQRIAPRSRAVLARRASTTSIPTISAHRPPRRPYPISPVPASPYRPRARANPIFRKKRPRPEKISPRKPAGALFQGGRHLTPPVACSRSSIRSSKVPDGVGATAVSHQHVERIGGAIDERSTSNYATWPTGCVGLYSRIGSRHRTRPPR